MNGYVDDIEEATESNEDLRRGLYTGANWQLVLMTLKPGEEIGEETHEDGDQFFRIEEGEGEGVIDGVTHELEDDFAVVIPAGARHNVINPDSEPLMLYTISGPPEHRNGVLHESKMDVTASVSPFDKNRTE